MPSARFVPPRLSPAENRRSFLTTLGLAVAAFSCREHQPPDSTSTPRPYHGSGAGGDAGHRPRPLRRPSSCMPPLPAAGAAATHPSLSGAGSRRPYSRAGRWVLTPQRRCDLRPRYPPCPLPLFSSSPHTELLSVLRQVVYRDRPQPIGHNATLSAPHMHAIMLELLHAHARPGARVLDVGSGSGYISGEIFLLHHQHDH